MDYVSEQRLLKVIPELANEIRVVSSLMESQHGTPIRVVQGLRNWADQEKIWEQGRNGNPGPTVTDAPPGYSMHEFGLAVDCMPSVNGMTGPYKQDEVAGSQRYVAMVAIAEAQGLVSGSTWISRKDWPHLQVRGVPATPTDAMRADFANGGLTLVWSNTLAGKYAEVT